MEVCVISRFRRLLYSSLDHRRYHVSDQEEAAEGRGEDREDREDREDGLS